MAVSQRRGGGRVARMRSVCFVAKLRVFRTVVLGFLQAAEVREQRSESATVPRASH